MHHVAEVDDAHDARLIVGGDQHVVEVVVVVDHLRPQRRQARQHVRREARHERLGQRAALVVHEAVELFGQPMRRGDVPQQVMRRARVREAVQRAVQPGQPAAHGAPLCGGALGLADLDAVQVGQHAHACLDAFGERNRAVRASLQCPHDARHRLLRRHAGDVVERRDLEVDDLGRLGWIADLEDVATAVGRLHQAVLVTLARQRPGGTLDAVEAADQGLHRRGREVWRRGAQRGHRPSSPGSWRTSVKRLTP